MTILQIWRIDLIPYIDKGMRVWLYTPRRKKGISPKLQAWWTGPYEIAKRLSDVTYQITKGKESLVVHVDRLKLYVEREKKIEKRPRKPEVVIECDSADEQTSMTMMTRSAHHTWT